MTITGDAIEDNKTRAHWALTALEAFGEQTGQDSMLDGTLTVPDDILCEVAGDLIADLFHLARLNDVDPEHLVDRGRMHYDAEVSAEQAAKGVEEWEEGSDAFHYKAP